MFYTSSNCRIRLLFHLLQYNNSVLYNLFYVYFADCFNIHDCLILVFLNHAEARSEALLTNSVQLLFGSRSLISLCIPFFHSFSFGICRNSANKRIYNFSTAVLLKVLYNNMDKTHLCSYKPHIY
jgi:hypothetical protein